MIGVQATVEPVGTARQAYRITIGPSVWQIRTTSPRRFLVVSVRGRYVVKRTNDIRVAENLVQANPDAYLLIDRREVDGR